MLLIGRLLFPPMNYTHLLMVNMNSAERDYSQYNTMCGPQPQWVSQSPTGIFRGIWKYSTPGVLKNHTKLGLADQMLNLCWAASQTVDRHQTSNIRMIGSALAGNVPWSLWIGSSNITRDQRDINPYHAEVLSHGFFSIWNRHKCLGQLFPLHLNT